MELEPNLFYYLIGILIAILWNISVYRKKYVKMWYGKNGANKTLFTL